MAEGPAHAPAPDSARCLSLTLASGGGPASSSRGRLEEGERDGSAAAPSWVALASAPAPVPAGARFPPPTLGRCMGGPSGAPTSASALEEYTREGLALTAVPHARAPCLPPWAAL